jgi:hypothetical protein
MDPRQYELIKTYTQEKMAQTAEGETPAEENA